LVSHSLPLFEKIINTKQNQIKKILVFFGYEFNHVLQYFKAIEVFFDIIYFYLTSI
jgi:hypothetical protein